MSSQAATLKTRVLRNTLRALGISISEMAVRAGISESTAGMVHRGQLTTARMQHRIETALGRAVWSSQAEFARKQALIAWLGFDFIIMSRLAVCRAARERGISMKGTNVRRALVNARLFEAYAAAHPSPARPRPRPRQPRPAAEPSKP